MNFKDDKLFIIVDHMIFLLCFHSLGDVVCSGEVFEDHREERVPGSSLGEVYNHGWGI